MLAAQVLDRAMAAKSVSRTAFLAFLFLLLISPVPQLVDGSFSLGLRETWRGMEQGFKKGKHHQPTITVHYPGGEVRSYEWSAVRPFLWAYVCRLCVHFPHRCHGDTELCRLRWRGKTGRQHKKRMVKA